MSESKVEDPDRTGDVNTGGGPYFRGSVKAEGGNIHIGHVFSPDVAHDVEGLGGSMNPYLGLRAFTYDDRASFAGRESSVDAAVRMMTDAGDQRTVLFITGASGSGKSSLAQAGVLPALEAYYRQECKPRAPISFRPSKLPLTQLAHALFRLGLPDVRRSVAPSIGTPEAFTAFVSGHTATDQVNMIVIDQFEELFAPAADPEEREAMIGILSDIAPFDQLRTHFLVTLRSDYLGQLFNLKLLYDLHEQGLKLREMNEDELRVSIQKPLHAASSRATAEGSNDYKGKSWEDALVDELAQQASRSATYLPLLQLSLHKIWEGSQLTLAAYRGMGFELTSAARTHADEVVDQVKIFGQRSARPEADRQTIMKLMLDLVQVSVHQSALPDVRVTRKRVDLVGKVDDQTARSRERLIEELTRERLLSIRHDEGGDNVEIVHESLIANWDRLRMAVDAERQTRQRRTNFEQALKDWRNNHKADGYLLTGTRLAEARELQTERDIAMLHPDVPELLERSIDREKDAAASLAEGYFRNFLMPLYHRFASGATKLTAWTGTYRTEAEKALIEGWGWTADSGFTLSVVIAEPPINGQQVERLFNDPEPVDVAAIVGSGRPPGPRRQRKARFAKVELERPDGRNPSIYVVRRSAPDAPFEVYDVPTTLAASRPIVRELEAGQFQSDIVRREVANFRETLKALVEVQSARIEVITLRDFESAAFQG